MTEDKYAVYETNQRLVADSMALYDALLLIKAIMEDAYEEPDISFTIRRMPPKED